MKEFEFTIRDEAGLHARPAGMLVALVKSLDSSVTLEAKGKSASGARLFAVMGLGIAKGDRLRVKLDGGDEEANLERLRAFFNERL